MTGVSEIILKTGKLQEKVFLHFNLQKTPFLGRH